MKQHGFTNPDGSNTNDKLKFGLTKKQILESDLELLIATGHAKNGKVKTMTIKSELTAEGKIASVFAVYDVDDKLVDKFWGIDKALETFNDL